MSESSATAAAGGPAPDEPPVRLRPYACTFDGCEQAYARLEHLERHLRTHTGQKYECLECGRAFARTDVLKRHKKLHEREGDPNSNGRKQAALERSPKACQACAASKVKCDGGKPCYRCSSSSRECVYNPEPPEGSRPEKRRRDHSPSRAPSETSNGDLLIQQPEISDSNFADFQLPPLPSTSAGISTSPQLTLPEGHVDPFAALHPPMAPVDYSFGQPLELVAENAPQGGLSSLFEMQLGGSAYNGGTQQPFMDPLFGFNAISPGRVDGQDSGLELATDDGMFWSAFLSPPNPIAAPEMDGEASTSPNAPTPRRGRIMVAATGVATRHGSPAAQDGGESSAGPSKAWPVWNPAEKDSGITVETVADHQPGLAAIDTPELANMPRIDEDVRMSILETLRFAQLTDHEYHSLYRTMSRLKLETYNTLLRLYFVHFHPVVPFLHIPSFNPRSTVGFLLLVILAIGAVHAPLAGALQLGRVLLEVSRRGIEHLTNRDNRLARSLPMSQALLLWSTIKWLGSPRLLELSEVFRCTFVTQLRRLQVFDERSTALPPDASVQERWAAFVASEERKRTGMACFLLESEFTTLMHLSPTLVLAELKTSLPCSDEFWNAPTAEAWDALHQLNLPAPTLRVGALFKMITADSAFPLPASIRLNPFACHLLVNAIHLLVWSSAQLSFIPNVAELAATNVRRSLSRLGRGENEFAPSFGTAEGEEKFSAAGVSYHLAHIATHLRLEELDVVAGRWSSPDAASAKAKIVSWMVSNGEQARIVALHAGQLVRLVHHYPTYGTYESSSVFYAALCLLLYSRSLIISSSGFPSTNSDTTTYPLDSPQYSPTDPSIFIATGSPHPPSLTFEGIGSLADSAAPKKILTALAGELSVRTGAVWRIGQVLASVLMVIAGQESA